MSLSFFGQELSFSMILVLMLGLTFAVSLAKATGLYPINNYCK